MEKSFEKRDLTKKSENIADWYNDVVLRAKLCSYSDVKGSIVIRPYGYAIWENTQKILNAMFKTDGFENCYFPMLIPMSFIQKEKDHIEGFAPELFTIDRIGEEELSDPLVLRPTSETIMYRTFADWVQGHRDLPIKINQWCNIFRAEKRTFPFIRTREFLWQEGHTAFSNEKENVDMVFRALDWYKTFYEKYMAIATYVGIKSQSEKFAGAKNTYTVETVCPNGKALQACTSHDLADHFAKAFDVKFLDENGKQAFAYQSSFGLSTRSVGALVLVHGDDLGLIMPPKIAPIQVVILPIFKKNETDNDILLFAQNIEKILSEKDISVKIDLDDAHTLGYKINEWELKGVPLRIEIGSKEMESKTVKAVRRDDFSKQEIPFDQIKESVQNILQDIQNSLFEKSLQMRNEKTKEADNYDDFKEYIEQGNLVRSFWCENRECEQKIKEETSATVRCLELDRASLEENGKCVYCNNVAKNKWLFGKSY